jgi:hypothetical protein
MPGATRKRSDEVEDKKILEMLEDLAQRLSIELRYEPIKKGTGYSEGGLCQLKGRYILIINPSLSIKDRIRLLRDAVRRFDLSAIYMKPWLRRYLEKDSSPLNGSPP